MFGHIPDQSSRILVISGSKQGKTKSLFNIIKKLISMLKIHMKQSISFQLKNEKAQM